MTTQEPTREDLILSEYFLNGIADDWAQMTRASLDMFDLMLGTTAVAPYVFMSTPRAFLRVYSERLAQLTRMVDGELKRREDQGDYHPIRDADMDDALELQSQGTQASAMLRAMTQLEGNDPDKPLDEPERPSQAA